MLRIAPGRTVWTTVAMVVETLKMLLSASCSVPLFVTFRLGDVASEKVNGWGGAPEIPVIAFRTAGRSPGTLP